MQSAGTGTQEYGPFHRLRNPTTQTDAVALLQVQSREIWGSTARWSHVPTVRAYVGPLPSQAAGIEFTTPIPPSRMSNGNAFWYPGDLGVRTNSRGFAVIPIMVARQVP
jgi:hypothetical protein